MNWTMPRPVLQWVAVVLIVASVGSFGLGIASAPSRGRLPGERLSGQTGAVLQAVEATPLGDDRIEGSSPAPQLSDEEKARLADEKEAREAEALAKGEAEKAAAGAITPVPTVTPTAPVAEPAKPPAQPTPEEPPF